MDRRSRLDISLGATCAPDRTTLPTATSRTFLRTGTMSASKRNFLNSERSPALPFPRESARRKRSRRKKSPKAKKEMPTRRKSPRRRKKQKRRTRLNLLDLVSSTLWNTMVPLLPLKVWTERNSPTPLTERKSRRSFTSAAPKRSRNANAKCVPNSRPRRLIASPNSRESIFTSRTSMTVSPMTCFATNSPSWEPSPLPVS
mmetsp:Transcript_15808/g.32669  ORF Transcript_15808/g.32669 Transcript_15808/m.32669 type:complete len:201 (-) Transcript_15808:979-1581(-)